MSEASRDENFVTTLLAVSSVDGVTPVTLYANPTTHRLLVDLSGGSGYTNLTQFVDQTPWRVFYSNGSGDVTELAFGGAGTYLQSNGAALAPTWVTPSGTGDVVGPASATDNAVARYDGATGKLIQNSGVTISDTSYITSLGITANNPVDGTTPVAIFDTNTGAQPFYVTRTGVVGESLSIKVDDENVIFESIQDEDSAASGGFQFLLDDGGTASPNFIVRTASSTNALFTVNKAGISAFKNFTDAASNQVIVLEGDRATPAANDEIYQSFRLSDSVGNQDEMGRITLQATDVTSTSEDSRFILSTMVAGAFSQRFVIENTSIRGASNDVLALGTTSQSFSDLFLASGAVINFNAGNATLTHSAGLLTSNVPLSLGTTNALTAGSIELGAASDTTITRTGAGAIAVEGVGVALNSVSLPHTASQFEVGNASDTSITRVSAGVIAVEGVTVPTISSTNTLTNKRVTKRTGTATSSATPTINTDNVDYYSLTAQAVDITSMTTNLTGTPTTAQQLRIDITGTAARAITWGASFANGPVALPTTTVTTTRLYVLLEYDGTIWRCMASGSTV